MLSFALFLLASEPTERQVEGVGTNSCGSFLVTANSVRARVPYVDWMAGFFSHYNITNRENIFDIDGNTDVMGEMAWLDRYCAARPLIPFATAVEAMLNELRDQEIRRRNSN